MATDLVFFFQSESLSSMNKMITLHLIKYIVSLLSLSFFFLFERMFNLFPALLGLFRVYNMHRRRTWLAFSFIHLPLLSLSLARARLNPRRTKLHARRHTSSFFAVRGTICCFFFLSFLCLLLFIVADFWLSDFSLSLSRGVILGESRNAHFIVRPRRAQGV